MHASGPLRGPVAAVVQPLSQGVHVGCGSVVFPPRLNVPCAQAEQLGPPKPALQILTEQLASAVDEIPAVVLPFGHAAHRGLASVELPPSPYQPCGQGRQSAYPNPGRHLTQSASEPARLELVVVPRGHGLQGDRATDAVPPADQ